MTSKWPWPLMILLLLVLALPKSGCAEESLSEILNLHVEDGHRTLHTSSWHKLADLENLTAEDDPSNLFVNTFTQTSFSEIPFLTQLPKGLALAPQDEQHLRNQVWPAIEQGPYFSIKNYLSLESNHQLGRMEAVVLPEIKKIVQLGKKQKVLPDKKEDVWQVGDWIVAGPMLKYFFHLFYTLGRSDFVQSSAEADRIWRRVNLYLEGRETYFCSNFAEAVLLAILEDERWSRVAEQALRGHRIVLTGDDYRQGLQIVQLATWLLAAYQPAPAVPHVSVMLDDEEVVARKNDLTYVRNLSWAILHDLDLMYDISDITEYFWRSRNIYATRVAYLRDLIILGLWQSDTAYQKWVQRLDKYYPFWRNPYLLKSFPFLDSYNHKDKFLQILHQFWQASDKKQREIADTYFWRSTGNMPIFRQITVLNSFMKRNAVNALFHDDIFDYFHRKTAPGQKFVRYPAPYEISGFYKIGELAPFRESLVKLEQELRKKYRREAKLTRQDLQKLPGDLAEQYQKMADFVATCPLDYFNRLYLHFPHVGLFYLEEQMAIQRQIFQQETIPTFYDGQEIIFSGRDVEKIVFASPKKFTVYFRQNQNAPDRIHPVPARTIEVTLAHRLSELMQVKHWPFEQPLQRGESARFPRGGNSPALLQPSWPMKFPQYVSLNTTGGGTALAYPHLKYAEIDFRWLTPEQRAEFKDFLTSSDREGKVLLANTITYQMANVLKIDNEMLQLYLDPHLLHFFVSFIRERKSMRYAPVTYLQRMAERVATEDQLLQDMQTRQQEQVAKKAQEERERQKRKFDKVVDRLANDLAQEIGEQLSHDEAVEEAREAGENSRHKILQELEARLIVHNVLQTEEVLQEHAPEHQYPLTLQDIDPAWLQSAQQVIAERINQTVQKVIDKAHRSNVEKLASKFKYDLDQQVLRKIIAQLGVVPHLIDPTWVTFPLTVREDLLDLRTEDFRQHYPPDKALLSSPEMQAILIAAIDLVRPLPQNPPLVQDAGSDAQDPVANIYRFLVLQRLQMYPEYNTNRQLAVAFEDYLQNLSNDPAQKIYKFWMDLILCDAPQTDNQLLVAQLEELTLDDVRFTGWLEELEYLRLMMRYEPPFKDDGYLSAQQRRKIYQHYFARRFWGEQNPSRMAWSAALAGQMDRGGRITDDAVYDLNYPGLEKHPGAMELIGQLKNSVIFQEMAKVITSPHYAAEQPIIVNGQEIFLSLIDERSPNDTVTKDNQYVLRHYAAVIEEPAPLSPLKIVFYLSFKKDEAKSNGVKSKEGTTASFPLRPQINIVQINGYRGTAFNPHVVLMESNVISKFKGHRRDGDAFPYEAFKAWLWYYLGQGESGLRENVANKTLWGSEEHRYNLGNNGWRLFYDKAQFDVAWPPQTIMRTTAVVDHRTYLTMIARGGRGLPQAKAHKCAHLLLTPEGENVAVSLSTRPLASKFKRLLKFDASETLTEQDIGAF